MERGRPKSIRTTILLEKFEKIGKRAKASQLKRKKHEKLLNIFFNKFYNLLRSFFYNCSDPEYNRVKELVEPELAQLFLSSYWPKKFTHKSDIKLYDEKMLKAQFSMISCKNLMKHFLCFSRALQEFGVILSEMAEESLESLFSYRCIEKSQNSKKLWKCLIMDLASAGKNSEKRKLNLENIYQYLNPAQKTENHMLNLEEIYEPFLITEKSLYDQDLVSTLDSLKESEERIFEINLDNFSISSEIESIEELRLADDFDENLYLANDEYVEDIDNF
ncbi:unnamed protein product [Blepharisma stoltei]|uniref:Uncharacterized protein n=1 Tax=Blepharisma stoltei TaxID=1481888 RepID=A0AAU9K3S0_9CILI|nr:unnamed protein product [Blepharisma stoltei]